MAYNDSLVAPSNLIGQSKQFVYSSGTEQESVLIPIRDIIGVQIAFSSAGTAKMQATIDPYDTVTAGTCNWVDWDLGTISSTSQSNCHKATAIRVVRTSGTIIMTVTI